MKVEIVIYIYGAVCASMIVFNIIYNLLLKGSGSRMQNRCQKMRSKINAQISRLAAGKNVEEAHLQELRRKLSHINHLMAFHQVLQEDMEKKPDLYREYRHQMRPVVIYMAAVYRDKENMQAGYFAYFLSCYTADKQMAMDSLQDILLDYVQKSNLYCRFNALQALYHFGTPETIAKALRIADDGSVFLHEKLITEGLLSYTGDYHALIEELWKNIMRYSPHTQLAILNYIRFRSGEYQREMYEIMMDKKADKELRLAAIRYCGKYPYEPVYGPLLAFVEDKDDTKWEFATVAASSLASYEGAAVIDALKEALHSSNWYVRYAAAQSLEHLHVNYGDVVDITAGSDRYAREMLMYRLESRKLQSLEV